MRKALDRVRCNMRLLLTGTPLQNTLKELFTLINFLFPGILTGSNAFDRAFGEKPKHQQDQLSYKEKREIQMAAADAELSKLLEADKLDATVADRTVELLNKLMLRRTKNLVVKLPTKRLHDVWLPLAPASLSWYQRMLTLTAADPSREDDMSLKQLVSLMSTLRLYCLHPRSNVVRAATTQKLELLIRQRFDMPVGSEASRPEAKKLLDDCLSQASEDRKLVGAAHVKASSKLAFLDKMLCHLHAQSLRFSSQYRQAWEDAKETRAINRMNLYAETLEEVANPSLKNKADPSAAVSALQDFMKPVPELVALVDEWKAIRTANQENKSAPAAKKTSGKKKDDAPVVDEEAARKAKEVAVMKKIREALGLPEVDEEPEDSAVVPVVPVGPHDGYERDVLVEGDELIPQRYEGREDRLLESSIFDFRFKSGDEPSTIQTLVDGKTVEVALPSAADSDTEDEEGDDKKPSKSEAKAGAVKEEEDGDVDMDAASIEKVVSVKKEPLPHKVLVFSQFQLVLDEIERYCRWRGFSYCRLDGSTNRIIRELDIRDFNRPEDNHLVYLISTRAGGLGINLVSANHVVMYDEDWNPFIDLQAIDRAHRIGQKREVNIFKLITEWTVEERMAFRRDQKLKLDKRIVTTHNAGCEAGSPSPTAAESDDINATEEMEGHKDEDNAVLSPDEIRRLLTHGSSVLTSLSLKDAEERLNKHSTLLEKLTRPHLPLPNEADILKELEQAELEGHREGEVILASQEEEEVAPAPAESKEDSDVEMSTPLPTADSTASGLGMYGLPKRVKKKVAVWDPYEGLESSKNKAASWRDKRCVSTCLLCDERIKTFDKESQLVAKQGLEVCGVRCTRCPQAYHAGCCDQEDLEYSKSMSFVCPCHSCESCGRAASSAGGHLLHCLDCTEALCFDCFPDDHKRVLPEEGFFDTMNRMGWSAYGSPDRYITYRCNGCRARMEIRRRMNLKEEERLAELRAQQEARAKQKAKGGKGSGGAGGSSVEEASSLASLTKAPLSSLPEEGVDHAVLGDRFEQLQSLAKTFKSSLNTLFDPALITSMRKAMTEQKKAAAAAKKDGKLEDMRGPSYVACLPDNFFSTCGNCHLPLHVSKGCTFLCDRVAQAVTKEEEAPASGEKTTSVKRVQVCAICKSADHGRFACDQAGKEEVQGLNKINETLLKVAEALNKVKPECRKYEVNGKPVVVKAADGTFSIPDFEVFKKHFHGVIEAALQPVMDKALTVPKTPRAAAAEKKKAVAAKAAVEKDAVAAAAAAAKMDPWEHAALKDDVPCYVKHGQLADIDDWKVAERNQESSVLPVPMATLMSFTQSIAQSVVTEVKKKPSSGAGSPVDLEAERSGLANDEYLFFYSVGGPKPTITKWNDNKRPMTSAEAAVKRKATSTPFEAAARQTAASPTAAPAPVPAAAPAPKRAKTLTLDANDLLDL